MLVSEAAQISSCHEMQQTAKLLRMRMEADVSGNGRPLHSAFDSWCKMRSNILQKHHHVGSLSRFAVACPRNSRPGGCKLVHTRYKREKPSRQEMISSALEAEPSNLTTSSGGVSSRGSSAGSCEASVVSRLSSIVSGATASFGSGAAAQQQKVRNSHEFCLFLS